MARTECRRGGLVTAYGRKARRGWYQESLHFSLDSPEVGGSAKRLMAFGVCNIEGQMVWGCRLPPCPWKSDGSYPSTFFPDLRSFTLTHQPGFLSPQRTGDAWSFCFASVSSHFLVASSFIGLYCTFCRPGGTFLLSLRTF